MTNNEHSIIAQTCSMVETLLTVVKIAPEQFKNIKDIEDWVFKNIKIFQSDKTEEEQECWSEYIAPIIKLALYIRKE